MDDNAQSRYREEEEKSTQQRAAILGLHYLDTRGVADASELATGVMDISLMYANKIVPLRRGNDEKSYVFGATASTPQSFLEKLKRDYINQGLIAEINLISMAGFREFMHKFDPPKEITYDDVKIAAEGDSDTLRQVSDTLESVSTDKILAYLIDQADRLNASDIHIENQRQNVRIRFRVNGMLHPIAEISHDKYHVLQASIASKANISTANPEAQSGHMQQIASNDPDRLINMRIETIPTTYGQDAVIRLFNFDESLLSIDHLGLDELRLRAIREVITHPHGMVMVVGPTGSGKSTTLYSILNALNETSRKILTLEDPVEVTIPGISQIPVNTSSGESFAEKLWAVLRLDPDIVMVGEVRDVDTARTAIQASITGHLVLSTFHASSAAAAFSRMIDMIGQNPIFSNAIRLVIAQRLIRQLDDQTKQPYHPDEATKSWIRESLGELPSGIEKPDLSDITLYRPGTSQANPFGYVGRMMIMEQLIVTDKIQKYIRGETKDLSVTEIERVAKDQGMLTMLQDGILRALRGETTLEEINRVL